MWVAPNSRASSSFRGSRSTAMIFDAPASRAPAMAASPTPAAAEHRHRVAPGHLAGEQRGAEAGHHAAAEEARGLGLGPRVDLGGLAGGHEGLLGEGADAERRAELDAVEGHLLGGVVGGEAVPGAAPPAGPALAADGPPVEDDEVAGRDLGDVGADRLDHAGRLVAEQERELVVDGALAVVQVGVADPARLDRDQHLAGTGVGHLDGLDRDRLALALRHHPADLLGHASSLLVAALSAGRRYRREPARRVTPRTAAAPIAANRSSLVARSRSRTPDPVPLLAGRRRRHAVAPGDRRRRRGVAHELLHPHLQPHLPVPRGGHLAERIGQGPQPRVVARPGTRAARRWPARRPAPGRAARSAPPTSQALSRSSSRWSAKQPRWRSTALTMRCWAQTHGSAPPSGRHDPACSNSTRAASPTSSSTSARGRSTCRARSARRTARRSAPANSSRRANAASMRPPAIAAISSTSRANRSLSIGASRPASTCLEIIRTPPDSFRSTSGGSFVAARSGFADPGLTWRCSAWRLRSGASDLRAGRSRRGL